MFAFYLGRNQEESAITLGGYDASKINGSINWNDVIWENYWMLPLDKVLINGENTQICNNDCAAIIDSGTSLITCPTGDLFVLAAMIGNFECSDYENLPTIEFEIGGVLYPLTPEDYIITVNQNEELQMYEDANPENIEGCAATFVPFDLMADNRKVWILGDTFMSGMACIFDRAGNRVGFANKTL